MSLFTDKYKWVIERLPRPYYATDTVILYHEDSNDLIKHIPYESIDLVATDPPYGIMYRSGMRKFNKFEIIKNDHELHLPLDELWKATKKTGAIFYFYSFKNTMTVEAKRKVNKCLDEANLLIREGSPNSCTLASGCIEEARFLLSQFGDERIKNEIIWDKRAGGMGDLEGDFGSTYETIAFMPRSEFKLHGDKRYTNLWSITREGGGTIIHPNQKPLSLMKRIIEVGSEIGDLVIDPFAGSGTTGVVTNNLGRFCILCEIEEKHCKEIVKRLSQIDLFATLNIQPIKVEQTGLFDENSGKVETENN